MGSYQNFIYENMLFLLPQPDFSVELVELDPLKCDIGWFIYLGLFRYRWRAKNEINESQVIENNKWLT